MKGLLYLRGPTGGNSIYLDGNSDSYINNGANFGIGTTAPGYKLDVRDSVSFRFEQSASQRLLFFGQNDHATIHVTGSTHKLALQTGGPGVEFQDAAGNHHLTVLETGTNGAKVHSPSLLQLKSDADSIYLSAAEHLYLDVGTRNTYSHIFRDGTGEFARFKNARLGIGTSAPDSPLDIRGDGTLLTLSGSANAIMKVFSNTDDASIDIYAGADGNVETGYVQFYDDNTKKWFIGKDTGNDFLIYDVTRGAAAIEAKDNSDLLLMQGGGNVGIGTTSPAKTLHIKKDAGHFRISSG